MQRYFNLKGNLNDYGCAPFRTASTTRSANLIMFQKQLNDTLAAYKYKEASAGNVQALWETLHSINDSYRFTPEEKAESKYAEIYSNMDRIGERFADAAENAFNRLSNEDKYRLVYE